MNWQIIGHQQITNYLEQAILNERLAHAWLFYGSKQLGKRKLAKQFAKILLCSHQDKNKKSIPCEQCEQCIEFNKGTHPDVYIIEKGKQEKNISVEQIRELRNKLINKSFFKSYKIAIIEGAEFLSLAAANALLKTLEEPLGKTVIILVAESLSSIPKTLLSRSQKIKFLAVATKDIYNYLAGQKKFNDKEILDFANLSQGRPGRAVIFSSNSHLWKVYLGNLNTFFKLISASDHEKINFVEIFLSSQKKITDQNNLILPMLNLWQSLFRDILLLKNDLSAKIINSKVKSELNQLTPYFSLEKLQQINSKIEQTRTYLKQNANPKLVLENLVLNF